jgi:transposase-like protein
MIATRWPDGVVKCPRCGSASVRYLHNARVYKCATKHPLRKFSLKVGTAFEDSPLPLEKWLPAMWMICNDKNGISSWELHRALGVTQKTAWFMLHRIRLSMQDGAAVKLGATGVPVEVDETFVGGKMSNMHKRRKLRFEQERSKITNAASTHSASNWGKTIVMGMLERRGRVQAKVVPSRQRKHLEAVAAEHIEPGANVITDEFTAYYRFPDSYTHEVINHIESYVNGHVHTNGIENFWSLLKRSLNGTYISVEPFHLFCSAMLRSRFSVTITVPPRITR